MESEKFFNDQNQFSVSHELVLLLEWFMYHKRDQMKTLVKRAVSQGLSEHIRHETKDAVLDSNFLYYTIVDFFDTLEVFLQEAMNEEIKQQLKQDTVLKTMPHFDAATIDKVILEASLEKVVKQIASSREGQVDNGTREKLLKEVLLRWKPIKQETSEN